MMEGSRPTAPCLEVAGLEVRYAGGAHAVRGIDLRVGHGETVALVGESGSGKTTIAHAILGLLPRGSELSGTVVLRGSAVREPDVQLVGLTQRAWRSVRGRRVGYVGQNPFRAFDPLRTVGHHVASAWGVHGLRPPNGAVARLLEELGIDDAPRQVRLHPHEWSGGMLQRACIAAARALGPQLVVADEPTSALDADIALSTLHALKSTGASLLVVTHDLSLAREVADRICVLYAGEVMEVGAAATLLQTPRHPYTRALVAALPRPGTGLPLPLPGLPPSPRLPRKGCAFASRCPIAHDRCLTERPMLEDGVACHGAVA